METVSQIECGKVLALRRQSLDSRLLKRGPVLHSAPPSATVAPL